MLLRAAWALGVQSLLLTLMSSAATARICRGWINVSGVEDASYVAGHGGDSLGNKLTIEHNGGFSITTSCKDDWDPHGFKLFKLLGQTLSYTVDLSRVGCACNLAMNLVPLPARDRSGQPSKGTCSYVSYYCDASRVCGQFCPELDIMEANRHVFESTPRKCDAPSQGGHYSHCDRDGCGQNTNKMGVMDYGPGSDYTIDTTHRFDVHTDFYGSSLLATGGVFTGMVTRLQQGSRKLTFDHSSCNTYLSHLADAMASGMSVRIAYWGTDAAAMSWLDDPPCGRNASCSGGNAGDATISNIRISPHPAGSWRPSAAPRQSLQPTAGPAPGLPWPLPKEWPGWLPRVSGLPPDLARRLDALRQNRVAVALAVVGLLFCIPGLCALCAYRLQQRRHQDQLQQQRALGLSPHGTQVHMMPAPVRTTQLFPVQQQRKRSFLNSLLGCCCRRDTTYAPYGPYGTYYLDTGNSWGTRPLAAVQPAAPSSAWR